ncbi:hypothetical protein BGZ72_003071 [Mortierella alpina]|nr:hypothetical protein BGZ72_003071 [Mortierella alpina]
MNKQSISIFDISLLVDSICYALRTCDIVNCRKVCKAWNAAFASHEWRSVWLYKRFAYIPLPTIPLTTLYSGMIRDNARWIRSLQIALHDTFLEDSCCTNLQQLVCIYRKGSISQASLDESSLALLWRNNGLKLLNLDFYTSHVRRHVLPNLPCLTVLQSLTIRLSDALVNDYDLFLDVLQNLPPTLQDLTLENMSSEVLTTSPRTWKPSAIRRFVLYPMSHGKARHFLLPFLRSCPQLERLSLPSTSTSCAEQLVGTLASSCPRLFWLDLNSQRLASRPFGVECVYFARMHQKISVLSLDVYNDSKNVVVSTLLARSAATLRELYLISATQVRSLDVAALLRACKELRILHVDGSVPDRSGLPGTSITLQDLVEEPWASTHLQLLDLVVTDARDPCMVEENAGDDGREETARLMLQLHAQIQGQKSFQGECSFQFDGQSFETMPLEAGLQQLARQMSENNLLRVGLQWNA